MIEQKLKELSFEVKPDWREASFPELDDVQKFEDDATESYRILYTQGRMQEAEVMLEKIKEIKYAKQHLKLVQNMIFEKPTEKMKKMAAAIGVTIDNPMILTEFKKIQQQNLEDIKRLREGRKPVEKEDQEELISKERLEEYEREQKKIADEKKKKDEEFKEMIINYHKAVKEKERVTWMTMVLFGAFGAIWFGLIIFINTPVFESLVTKYFL